MEELMAYRTSNELCWVAEMGGRSVDLCIASWRVPQPIPRRVRLRLDADGQGKRESRPPGPAEMRGGQKSKPISIALRRKGRALDGVLRYDPDCPPHSWPVGSMFLPRSMFNGSVAGVIRATIDWD